MAFMRDAVAHEAARLALVIRLAQPRRKVQTVAGQAIVPQITAVAVEAAHRLLAQPAHQRLVVTVALELPLAFPVALSLMLAAVVLDH